MANWARVEYTFQISGWYTTYTAMTPRVVALSAPFASALALTAPFANSLALEASFANTVSLSAKFQSTISLEAPITDSTIPLVAKFSGGS